MSASFLFGSIANHLISNDNEMIMRREHHIECHENVGAVERVLEVVLEHTDEVNFYNNDVAEVEHVVAATDIINGIT